MSDKLYKTTQLDGSSLSSIEEAIQDAISKSTIKNLHWFEVVRVHGHIEEGKIQQYAVNLKAGATLEEFDISFPAPSY